MSYREVLKRTVYTMTINDKLTASQGQLFNARSDFRIDC